MPCLHTYRQTDTGSSTNHLSRLDGTGRDGHTHTQAGTQVTSLTETPKHSTCAVEHSRAKHSIAQHGTLSDGICTGLALRSDTLYSQYTTHIDRHASCQTTPHHTTLSDAPLSGRAIHLCVGGGGVHARQNKATRHTREREGERVHQRRRERRRGEGEGPIGLPTEPILPLSVTTELSKQQKEYV